MTDPADSGHTEVPSVVPNDEEPVEAYETDGGTVLYDAENPLAWIESTRAVTLDDAC